MYKEMVPNFDKMLQEQLPSASLQRLQQMYST